VKKLAVTFLLLSAVQGHADSPTQDSIVAVINQLSAVNKFCHSYYKIDSNSINGIIQEKIGVGQAAYHQDSFNAAVRMGQNRVDHFVEGTKTRIWCDQQAQSLNQAGYVGLIRDSSPNKNSTDAVNPRPAPTQVSSQEIDNDENGVLPPENDESDQKDGSSLSTAEKGLLKAFYFFLTGYEAADSNFVGRSYRVDPANKFGATVTSEFLLEKPCFIRQIINQEVKATGERSSSNTTYDFNKASGRYYTSQGRTMFTAQDIRYIVEATGDHLKCGSSNLFGPKLATSGCEDRITTNYGDEIIRDRAVKAFNYIMANYCRPMKPKPY
jgi:hypothetical protein